MGQKVNPIGLRVTVNKNWKSRWYTGKKQFAEFFHEDLKIRDAVKKRFENASVSNICIERYANRVRVTVFTARPGMMMGRKNQDFDRFREELTALTGKEIYLEISEIKQPDLDAQLVAENVALQLERRVSFRRAVKKAMKISMDQGALGIKICVSGRLGGAELARREMYKEGKIPLHTLSADIDYGFAEARTVAGAVGVKTWICRAPSAGPAKKEGMKYAANA